MQAGEKMNTLGIINYRCQFDVKRHAFDFSENQNDQLFGFKKESLTATDQFNQLIIKRYSKDINSTIQKQIHNKGSYELTYELRTKDHRRLKVLDKGMIQSNDTSHHHLMGALIIIEEAHEFLNREMGSQHYEMILDHLPGAIFYKDTQNNFVRVNQYVANQYNTTKETLIDKNLNELHDAQEADAYYQDDLKVINSGKEQLNILESWETSEGTKWVNTHKIPYRNDLGEIIGIIGMAFDVTQLIEAERANKIYEQIIQQSPSAIVMTDTDGMINYVNDAFERLTGYTAEEMLGKNPNILKYNQAADIDFEKLWESILSGHEWQGVFQNVKKNGEIYWEQNTIFPVTDGQNTIEKLVAIKNDITKQYLQDEKIKRLYRTDPLTAVFNRRGVMEKLAEEFKRQQRYPEEAYLCILDLDHFKKVNDQYGHDMGDEALKSFAQVCQETIRSTDIFGRIGGEEFSILLRKTSFEDGQLILERLRKNVENIAIPTEDRGIIHLTVSIGFTRFDVSKESFYKSLKVADQALYEAKDQGRNCVSYKEH